MSRRFARHGGMRRPLRGGVGGGAFAPTDISGVTLWLRADDEQVTYDGSNKVSGIAAMPGTSIAATQGTAVNRPTWQSSDADFGGHPTITFEIANSEHLRADGFASAASGTDTPWTVIVALKPSTSLARQDIVSWGNSGSATQFMRIEKEPTTELRDVTKRDDSGATEAAKGDAWTSVAQIASVVCTGTTVSQYWDGALAGMDGESLNVGAATYDQFAVAALVRTSVSNPYDGTIAEIVGATSALSDSDRARIEDYMAARYGI